MIKDTTGTKKKSLEKKENIFMEDSVKEEIQRLQDSLTPK